MHTNYYEKITVKKIIATPEKWERSDIDVELLLDTLTRLATQADEDPLLRFYKGDRFVFSGYSPEQPMIEAT